MGERDEEMQDPLAEELRYYQEKRSDLLQHYKGKFVVIKGTELFGPLDTAEAAYEKGLEEFGNVPFLIKRVEESEAPVRLPALTLGLMHAEL